MQSPFCLLMKSVHKHTSKISVRTKQCVNNRVQVSQFLIIDKKGHLKLVFYTILCTFFAMENPLIILFFEKNLFCFSDQVIICHWCDVVMHFWASEMNIVLYSLQLVDTIQIVQCLRYTFWSVPQCIFYTGSYDSVSSGHPLPHFKTILAGAYRLQKRLLLKKYFPLYMGF